MICGQCGVILGCACNMVDGKPTAKGQAHIDEVKRQMDALREKQIAAGITPPVIDPATGHIIVGAIQPDNVNTGIIQDDDEPDPTEVARIQTSNKKRMEDARLAAAKAAEAMGIPMGQVAAGAAVTISAAEQERMQKLVPIPDGVDATMIAHAQAEAQAALTAPKTITRGHSMPKPTIHPVPSAMPIVAQLNPQDTQRILEDIAVKTQERRKKKLLAANPHLKELADKTFAEIQAYLDEENENKNEAKEETPADPLSKLAEDLLAVNQSTASKMVKEANAALAAQQKEIEELKAKLAEKT